MKGFFVLFCLFFFLKCEESKSLIEKEIARISEDESNNYGMDDYDGNYYNDKDEGEYYDNYQVNENEDEDDENEEEYDDYEDYDDDEYDAEEDEEEDDDDADQEVNYYDNDDAEVDEQNYDDQYEDDDDDDYDYDYDEEDDDDEYDDYDDADIDYDNEDDEDYYDDDEDDDYDDYGDNYDDDEEYDDDDDDDYDDYYNDYYYDEYDLMFDPLSFGADIGINGQNGAIDLDGLVRIFIFGDKGFKKKHPGEIFMDDYVKEYAERKVAVKTVIKGVDDLCNSIFKKIWQNNKGSKEQLSSIKMYTDKGQIAFAVRIYFREKQKIDNACKAQKYANKEEVTKLPADIVKYLNMLNSAMKISTRWSSLKKIAANQKKWAEEKIKVNVKKITEETSKGNKQLREAGEKKIKEVTKIINTMWKEGHVLLWHGGAFINQAGHDFTEAGTKDIWWGPTSTSMHMENAYSFTTKHSNTGTLLQIEVPLDIENKAAFADFGSVLASGISMWKEKEVILWNIRTSWIQVRYTYDKLNGGTKDHLCDVNNFLMLKSIRQAQEQMPVPANNK